MIEDLRSYPPNTAEAWSDQILDTIRTQLGEQ